MSNKGTGQLDPVDRSLREMSPPQMGAEGVQVTIEKICGFELFNTRPYHNLEAWSDGYRVSDGTFRLEAEDLDDAIEALRRARAGTTEDDCRFASRWGHHQPTCCGTYPTTAEEDQALADRKAESDFDTARHAENEAAVAGVDPDLLRECARRDEDGAPCGASYYPPNGHWCWSNDEWLPGDDGCDICDDYVGCDDCEWPTADCDWPTERSNPEEAL